MASFIAIFDLLQSSGRNLQYLRYTCSITLHLGLRAPEGDRNGLDIVVGILYSVWQVVNAKQNFILYPLFFHEHKYIL